MHFRPQKVQRTPNRRMPMPPKLVKRRIQSCQRQHQHQRRRQSLHQQKVMVKEKENQGKEVKCLKGHLRLRNHKIQQNLKLIQKANQVCHVCFIQRVLAIVVQNVLLHMWSRRHQPRRRQSRPRLPLQQRQPLPLFWPAVQARFPELQHHLHQPLHRLLGMHLPLFVFCGPSLQPSVVLQSLQVFALMVHPYCQW